MIMVLVNSFIFWSACVISYFRGSRNALPSSAPGGGGGGKGRGRVDEFSVGRSDD